MKSNFLKFAERLSAVCVLAVGVVAAFSLDSCKKEPKEEPVEVVFPEAQTLNVQANTTQTLYFTINADWILYSDSEWATFGGEMSASGAAGDISIELSISDLGQSLEETSVAYLTLAAGSEEHVIYTINRAPEGTEFSVTDADGNEATSLTAGWQDYDYYTITANFEFAVSDQPEWLETEDAVTGSDGNPATAGFKVVDDASLYKYEQTGEITFVNETGTISFTYPISFAGMDADAIEFSDDNPGPWNWTVNASGETFSHEGVETDPKFTFAVLNDDYVIVIADCTYERDWVFYVDEEDSNYEDPADTWLSVTDDGQGTVSLACAETTKIRNAYVFAFPTSVYTALNDAHNGYGLNFIYDNDDEVGDYVVDEYEQYVVANVEQTTATGEESFAAQNGVTFEEYEVETECPAGYDFTSVLADYPDDAHVGYLPWLVETSVEVTVLPLTVNGDWICDPKAFDANGDTCYGQSYYSIEGGQQYKVGNTQYYGVNVYLNSTPEVDYFYLVFNNPDDTDSDTWVLFFYGEAASPAEYGLTARVSTNTGASYTDVTIETTCPESLNTPSQRGANTPEDIIDEYGGTTNVGYIPYQKGAQFNASVTPLGSANYVEGYDSWDESIYLEAKGWGSDYEDICEYEGGSYANSDDFGATIWCVDDLPDGIDFVFLAFKASDDDDDAIGLLFFYKGEGSGSDETDNVFDVSNGSTLASIDYETEYNGPYDLTDILEKYQPKATGYLAYALQTSYNVSFTDATASDEWIYDVKAYDYAGNDVFDAYEMECGSNWQTGVPYVNVWLEEDPGTLFYLVFNDGTDNYLFFFTTDQLPSEELEFKLYYGNATYNFTTEYDEDGPYDLSEIRQTYSPALEGFYPYQVETYYRLTFEGVTSDDTWITESYKAYTFDGSETISGVTFTTGSETDGTPYVQVTVATDPGQLFYIVFNDGTDNYIFYFTTDIVPGEGGTDGEIVVYTDSDWAAADDIYDVEDYSGTYDLASIVKQYEAKTAYYLPSYEAQTPYMITFADATSASSWITENYAAYNYSGTQIVVSNKYTGAASADGLNYKITTSDHNGIPYVNIQAGAVETTFYVVLNNGTDNFIIFFTPDSSEAVVEPEFKLYYGNATYNFTTEYDEDGPYDLSEIRQTYSPALEGFYPYQVETYYRLTFEGATSDDTWITESYKAYTFDGSETISGVTFKTGSESDGTPYVQVTVATDPGQLFYIVFTDDAGSNYIFYFTTDTVPSSGPQTDGEIVVYPSNNWGSNLEVKDAEDYAGSYDLKGIASNLDAATAWYFPGFAATTAYWVTFADATSSSSWITSNYAVYSSSGTQIVPSGAQGNATADDGTQYRIVTNTSNGIPYVQVMAGSADVMFYIVFNDGTNNYVVFFTPDDDDNNSGEGDETTWSAVPTDVATEWGASVWEDLYNVHGSSEAWKPTGTPELYSDNMLGFYNGDGSGYKFGTTGSIYRVQLAGGGSTTKCCIQFKVTTNGSISVTPGSSSSGSSRTLLIYNGDTEIGADEFSESTATTITHSVTGISGETVISICSQSSGINIFDIKWVPDGVSDGDDSGDDDDDAAFYICNSLTLEKITCESSYSGTYSSYVSYFFQSNGDFDHVGYLVCDWDWRNNDEYNYLVAPAPLSSTNEFGWEGSLVWDDGTTDWFDDYAEVEGGQSLTLNGVSYPATLLTVTSDPSEVFGLVFNNNGEKWVLLIISTK